MINDTPLIITSKSSPYIENLLKKIISKWLNKSSTLIIAAIIDFYKKFRLAVRGKERNFATPKQLFFPNHIACDFRIDTLLTWDSFWMKRNVKT